MNDRKATREALAALVATNTTLVEVYDNETLDFGGRSPVAMVQSDGTAAGPALTLSGHMRQQRYILSLWWRRGETTEDDMDELSAAIYDLLEANSGLTPDWGSLEAADGFSELDYPILDGVMYRRERIRVVAW